MHIWGDEDFDWEGLNDAGSFIHQYCMSRARLCIHWKEKYGTLRYEYLDSCLFSDHTPIHSILKPGRLFLHYNKINIKHIIKLKDRILFRIGKAIMNIERPIGILLQVLYISSLIRKYQLWIFRRAIFKAIEKWPHLEDEILEDAPEIVIGTELHEKYWS